MRVLQINKFLYPKGGDAVSALATGKLLSEKGHEVYYWGMEHPDNPEYPYKEFFVSYVDFNKHATFTKQLKLSLNILYSFEAKKKIRWLLQEIKPDIVHLHNFAHQLSPSILDAIKKYNVPIVMTMHDYKLACPAYLMTMDAKPCELCKDGQYYHCFLNKCIKGSLLKSLVSTLEMYLHHRLLHIYDKIDLYISPSRFLMNKVKEMGLNGTVVYLPNFVDVKSYKPSYQFDDESIIYVGRLSSEKGLITLIDAVKGIGVKLKIIGDGPLKEYLSSKVEAEKINNVSFLGYMKGKALQNEVRRSMFAVAPSEWYENNPRSVIEAFALGKPVVGARIGGIPELVRDGETGFTFEPGNINDLRDKIVRLSGNKDKIVEMGKKAREFVERECNPELHYNSLMENYKTAIDKHADGRNSQKPS